MDGMVKMAELKREYAGTGTSPALVRRHVKRLGIIPTLEVGSTRLGVRPQHLITAVEADRVRESIAVYLAQRGERVVASNQKTNVFYMVAIPPRCVPPRYKVGWTSDIAVRLGEYRTLVPDAEVVVCWTCPMPELERAAIGVLKRSVEQERSVRHIGSEVFEGDRDSILAILDRFFAGSGEERMDVAG